MFRPGERVRSLDLGQPRRPLAIQLALPAGAHFRPDARLPAYLEFHKPLATGRIDPWDELPPNLGTTELERELVADT
jgi:hypothetical protein